MKVWRVSGITIVVILLLGRISCACSQSTDDQVIKMLQEFYIQYNSIWSGDENPSSFKTRIFALQEKYCSAELLKEVRDLYDKYGFDHDLLINDLYGKSVTVNSIKIEKLSKYENTYIVSYPADISEPSKPNATTVVRLNVKVIKEGNMYKLHKVW